MSEGRTVYTKTGCRMITGRCLSSTPAKDGYPVVTLCKNWRHEKRRVHVLVALAFLGSRPTGYEIRHKDGNKANNAVSNLAYGSSQENSDDCADHGRFRRGTNHQNTVLTDEQVEELRNLPAGTRGNSVVATWAARNGVSKGHAYNIRNGRRRKD